jgi:GH25 family lysozyme M1 (1,4-beta-N-acetylmuramidase)
MADLIRGIDVSVYQGSINWELLRQARRDLAFAYIRTSEWRKDNSTGGLIDMYAERNIAGASRNGLIPGVYQRANLELNTPEKEAIEFVARIRYLDAWKQGSLIPAIDVEYTAPQASAPDLNKWLEQFVAAYYDMAPIKKLIFYTSSSYIMKYYPSALTLPINLWVAHTEKYSIPKGLPAEEWAGKANRFNNKGLLHQYTHSLNIAGVEENSVDGNCLFPGVKLKDIMV